MGRKLVNIENTRIVLSEKYHIYYYKRFERGIGCAEQCIVEEKNDKRNVMIGSVACTECEFNKMFGDGFVICKKIIVM